MVQGFLSPCVGQSWGSRCLQALQVLSWEALGPWALYFLGSGPALALFLPTSQRKSSVHNWKGELGLGISQD